MRHSLALSRTIKSSSGNGCAAKSQTSGKQTKHSPLISSSALPARAQLDKNPITECNCINFQWFVSFSPRIFHSFANSKLFFPHFSLGKTRLAFAYKMQMFSVLCLANRKAINSQLLSLRCTSCSLCSWLFQSSPQLSFSLVRN